MNYQAVKVDFTYTRASYMDKSIRVVLDFQQGTKHFADSFSLGDAGVHEIRRYALPDSFVSDLLWVTLKRNSGAVRGRFLAASSLYAHGCEGYHTEAPFGGATCLAFTDSGVGSICGSLDIYFRNGNSTETLRRTGGHYARPFEIYCAPGTQNPEGKLQFQLPCAMDWLQDSSDAEWFESADGKSGWKSIGKGRQMAPVDASYKGGIKYGTTHFYKARVKKHLVTGADTAWSEMVGPVKFFLGLHIDSIRFQGKTCAAQKDVKVYYKDDTLRKYNYQPRFWVFYQHPDSVKEIRYQLMDPGFSPVSLAGRKWQNQSVNPPVYVNEMPLRKGRYRLMHDFTPWNGFNCKLFFDTFTLADDLGTNFETLTQTLQTNACYGDKNAAVALHISGTDTTAKQWSSDSLNWKNVPDTLLHLGAGKYPVWVRNALHCTIKSTVVITEPPAYFFPKNIDTVLCLKQQLFVNAHHPNAAQYNVIYNLIPIKKTDTFTLVNAGQYTLELADSHGCKHTDTIQIRRKDLEITHDFLMPSNAFLSDTVFAVDVSNPASDKAVWKYSDSRINQHFYKEHTNIMQFPDTGKYTISLHGIYAGCGYDLSKIIHVIGSKDSSKMQDKYGYKGPLIQSFSIDPNPNDGQNFTIKVQLRDTADIVIYRIDPASGEITGDIDFHNNKYYAFTAFKSYTEDVFFLKLLAGNESKTIKVVVIP